MKLSSLRKIISVWKILGSGKKNAITTCIENNIPLTDENLKEVIEILQHKK